MPTFIAVHGTRAVRIDTNRDPKPIAMEVLALYPEDESDLLLFPLPPAARWLPARLMQRLTDHAPGASPDEMQAHASAA